MTEFIKFIRRERLYILLLVFVLSISAAVAISDKEKASDHAGKPGAKVQQVEAKKAVEDQSGREERLTRALKENKHLALVFTIASLAILLVLFLGVVTDIILLLRRLYGKQIDIRTYAPGKVSWDLWDIGKVVILFLFFGYIAMIIESLLARTFPIVKNDDFRTVFNSSILDTISVIFIIYFTVGQYKEDLRSLGITFKNFRKNVFYGVIGYLAILPAIFIVLIVTTIITKLVGYVPKEQVVVEMFMRQNNPAFLIYTSVFAAIAGPIVEELFFRAFMYSAVRKYIGIFWATLVTASLFALLHGHLIGFLPIMVLGILLAHLYEKTGSIVSSITVHMLHNFSMVVLVFLVKSVNGI